MDLFSLALTNLTSPPLLAFALGLLGAAIKSDIKIPDPVYQALSLYLLLGIGIKGGVALSEASLSDIAWPVVGALALGLVVPLVAFWLLSALTRLDVTNRGALAAHYGSTSLVTFTAALVFLETLRVDVEGFMTTLLAILEIPGIIVGLLLASRGQRARTVSWAESLREVITGKSLVLLAGGLVIGVATGAQGYERIEPFFGGLFTGVLTLFLLELGLVAGKRLADVRKSGPGLVVFALLFPVLAGTLGIVVGWVTGLSVGGATVLGVLAGSASYIAAPAAVRLALPQASPGVYLTASLGITFPFNLVLGIPLLYAIAGWIVS